MITDWAGILAGYNKKNGTTYPDIKSLFEALYKETYSARAIGRLFGLDVNTIRRKFKRCGIPLLGLKGSFPTKKVAIFQLLEQNPQTSIDEIAAQVDCHREYAVHMRKQFLSGLPAIPKKKERIQNVSFPQNPIRRKVGERTVKFCDCPHYEKCLNVAYRGQWTSWDCRSCDNHDPDHESAYGFIVSTNTGSTSNKHASGQFRPCRVLRFGETMK